ncbi:4-hydroxybenzoate octaprenyltransferase [Pseudomarimonas arenosa]|uniref:4-hydroxybenzoate octaprenyltransferase n=1 Tax=Pseudomarimonas arenosa TaxID=2774145 RepID=A0AAW3ZLR1_9GAMM|nr:4-hydroxybenzoate octaprenyltransferase [Pseudomarimonas arenosa]MBD8525850.1 4-hydroxybenzoate octaprenyltransferase [Pseudomarimonas arenosa]
MASPPERSPPAARAAVASAPPSDWRKRLDRYWRLIRADRPIGWLLLLWPTWWGLWLAAEGIPPWNLLLIFSAGVWLMRSAGCVINDYADRWLDPHVERTKGRPLATGEVGPREALALFAVLALAAFGLVLLTNTLTIQLSVVGVILAASYPYLKRHTWFPQVYLGLAFGWSIPMAFAAVQNEVPPLAWLLFAANVLWSTGYDTWYAMVDRDDDIRMSAKSTAILFGDMDLAAQAAIYLAFFAGLLMIGDRVGLPWPYHVAVGAAAVQVGWQFWVARRRQREACFRAFLSNNWTGLLIFAGIAAALWLKAAGTNV